jgi:hypothetical protein
MILLPQPSKSLDYRHAPPHLPSPSFLQSSACSLSLPSRVPAAAPTSPRAQ